MIKVSSAETLFKINSISSSFVADGPSHFAFSGDGWVSINNAANPKDTPERARSSACSDLPLAEFPGRQEFVKNE